METVLIVLVCCIVIALVVPITIAVEKQRSRRNKFEDHFELVFGLVSLGLFFIFQRGFFTIHSRLLASCLCGFTTGAAQN